MITEQLVVSRVDEREWIRQSEDLAYYFAKPLEMSRRQYLDTLPNFTPKPAKYAVRSDTAEPKDTLVLVQPPQPEKGLPLTRILDIVGLSYFNPEVLKMEDWQDDKRGFKTPSVPYATWLEDGTRNLKVSPQAVRENLLDDERGGTGIDGVFLYVTDRGTLRRHYINLPGSQVGSDGVPDLLLCFGGPGFDRGWVGRVDLNCGSVVAGRKIVTR